MPASQWRTDGSAQRMTSLRRGGSGSGLLRHRCFALRRFDRLGSFDRSSSLGCFAGREIGLLLGFRGGFFHRRRGVVVVGFRFGKIHHPGGNPALNRQPLQAEGRVLFNRAGVRLLFGNAHFGQEL
jgi:hypothetical protein